MATSSADITSPLAKKTKKKKGKSAYTSPEHIAGIKHVVEGRDLYYEKPETERVRKIASGKKDIGATPILQTEYTKEGKESLASNKELKQKIKGFAAEDEARSKLRAVADPDEVAKTERKRIARRRMRGRLGTLLSERQTLG